MDQDQKSRIYFVQTIVLCFLALQILVFPLEGDSVRFNLVLSNFSNLIQKSRSLITGEMRSLLVIYDLLTIKCSTVAHKMQVSTYAVQTKRL